MDKLTKGWVDYLRTNHRNESNNTTQGSTNKDDITNSIEDSRPHIEASKHPSLDADDAVPKEYSAQNKKKPPLPRPDNTQRSTRKRDSPDESNDPNSLNDETANATEVDTRETKKPRSPPLTPEGNKPPRSRNNNKPRDSKQGFEGRDTAKSTTRQLWTPEDGVSLQPRPASGANQACRHNHTHSLTHTHSHAHNHAHHTHSHTHAKHRPSPAPAQDAQPVDDGTPKEMFKQPVTRPISQEQLVAEVKGIYAGLVMVENKCIEVDNAQSSNTDAKSKLSNEQWQALIALHRTLLHEHHDFFLASQHPSANAALRRLASKYAMPARMWRHGIHSFLELLRHRLPESLEHMLAFLYVAYSMMALLYETVPEFESTWIECLGDLGRYRMAIEDDDIRDREIWTGVSRHWYSKASDKAPTTGRLYHHLAILARPNALQQLYYYAKSLAVPTPFFSARESVMTLFDPLLNSNTSRLAPIDAAFVRVHGIQFSGKAQEKLDAYSNEFLDLLDSHIGRTTKRWLESGYYIGISLGCSLLGYGDESNVLMKAISQKPEESDVPMDGSAISEGLDDKFKKALSFAVRTYEIVFRRWGDTNILTCLHTTLVFLSHMAQYPAAMACLERDIPWKLMVLMLNSILKSPDFEPRLEGDEFPRQEKEELPRPLPEDFAMRGLIYALDYFPRDWFDNKKIDEDEKYFELSSMAEERKERVVFLARKIAAFTKWITWDADKVAFSVMPEYDVEIKNTRVHLPDPTSGGSNLDLPIHDKTEDVELPDAEAGKQFNP